MERCKVSVFIAVSLDGFIARLDGSLDWLDRANQIIPAGEDCGYAAFMETIDTLVMGRHTFEKVLTFGEWPYGEKSVVVLSSRAVTLPPHLPPTVTVTHAAPKDLITRLTTQGAKHIYLDGGITIQRFLAENLVDFLTLTTIPILLGTGKPLFGSLTADRSLIHHSTTVYEFGFVQSTYSVSHTL